MQKDDRIVHLQIGGIGIEHLKTTADHDQNVAAAVDGVGVIEVDLEHKRLVMRKGSNAQRLQAVHYVLGIDS